MMPALGMRSALARSLYASVTMAMGRSTPMTSRDVAQVAMGAGLVAALGLPGALAVFGNAVPITLQTLGVMLCGSLLGARKGAAALLLFVALVAVGLPLLAGGRGGLGVFAGPSAGYLLAWPLAAWATGQPGRRRRSRCRRRPVAPAFAKRA